MSPVLYVNSVTFVLSSTSNVHSRMLEPGVSISFELADKQGAAIGAKYWAYRGDA